ncbi:hypothetical protein FKM82_018834 [Ascaphus truei]
MLTDVSLFLPNNFTRQYCYSPGYLHSKVLESNHRIDLQKELCFKCVTDPSGNEEVKNTNDRTMKNKRTKRNGKKETPANMLHDYVSVSKLLISQLVKTCFLFCFIPFILFLFHWFSLSLTDFYHP